MVTKAVGNRRLIKLANFVSAVQSAKPEVSYDQREIKHSCGAPACMLGHAGMLFSFDAEDSSVDDDCRFFALSYEEWDEIFSHTGCGDAGKNWRKAIRYLRSFVARRQRST